MAIEVTYDLIVRESEVVEQMKVQYLRRYGWTPVAGHEGRYWKHAVLCDDVALNTDGAASLTNALMERTLA
jgi:hypothetical protein